MKKFLLTLLSALLIVSGLAFITACDSCDKSEDTDVLTNYILSVSGLVEDDFELPLTISDKEVSWSSNNPAIEIVKGDGTYIAKINPADDAQTVTLTVTCGKESKTFEVTVTAFDVNYFANKYVFKQDKSTVFADFELDQTFTIGNKTADITWSVREQDSDYVAISEDGTTCKVYQTSIDTEVRISATFSYNDETRTVPYRMTVSYQRDHDEEVSYWYNNTDVSITMKGYVVVIATEYSSSFGNVSLYMVDEDGCAGYYLYRVKVDATNGPLLKPGVPVIVTGSTNTNYNGLMETNQNGNIVVDTDKTALTAEELAAKVYALDADILSGAPATIHHTASQVSLDKWTVKTVADNAPAAGSSATLFTLTKGDINVTVGVSKYMEGAYVTAEGNTVWAALCALQGSVKVGDVVSVSGILYHTNSGYQILPISADDVKVESVAATEVPAYAANVNAAITAVEKVINDATSTVLVADKTITIPETTGVEVKCELLHNFSKAVAIDGNEIKITVGAEEIASIKITYTVKDGDTVVYSTSTFHNIHSMKMSDAEIVENIKFGLTLSKTDITDSIELPGAPEYPTATVTWAMKEPVTGITVENNMLMVTPVTTNTQVVLVVTIANGEVTDTKEFTVTVLAVDEVATGTFKMAVEQNTLGKKLYFTGEMSGNYGALTEYYEEAVDVTVEKATGGHTLMVNGKYMELNSSHYITFVDEPTGVWVYDYTLKVFTWDVSGTIYYLGNYSTNADLRASTISYISGSNASTVGVSQFVAFFEEIDENFAVTDEIKVQRAIDTITLPEILIKDTALPVYSVEGVTISFESDNAAIAIEDGTMKITRGDADVSVKITLTATCNGASDTKDFTVVVKAISTGTPAASATLSFATTDARVSQDTNSQVWQANGITFTNLKGSSTTNVADYSNPVRLYANSTVKVECAGMSKVVFHCVASYSAKLLEGLQAANLVGANVTSSGDDITVEFEELADSFEFVIGSAQARVSSIDINPAA